MYRSFLHATVVGTIAGLATAAVAATSSGTETLYAGELISPVWRSGAFAGSHYRDFTADYLYTSVDSSAGGYDTAIRKDISAPTVDQVHPDFWVEADFWTSGSGSGKWWYGPKISVNWNAQQDDWYENYIIENASLSPSEWHQRLTNGDNYYFGDTSHDGATYRHYRVVHNTWVQYWAVRQSPRSSGAVSIKPILEMWRSHGLPNKKVNGIRLNIETSGQLEREFNIDNFYLPQSWVEAPSVPNPSDDSDDSLTSGVKRMRDRWQGRYLNASSASEWESVNHSALHPEWWSQQWSFERVDGDTYRVRNRWSGHYLTAPTDDAWDEIVTAGLNVDWWSQQWVVESAGSGEHRIRNRWSGLYLNAPEHAGEAIRQAPLQSGWSSQRFVIE